MRVLSRALRRQGEPVPLPWSEIPIKPGPGDVVMGLAAPGVGKSFISLRWAVYLAKLGRPVLMISTDTDYSDQAIRMASMLFNEPMSVIEADQEYWAGRLHDIDLPIRWSELHLDSDEFNDFLNAEVEFLGESPQLVVVDVVGDMLGKREENVGNYRHIYSELKKGARRHRTTVFALHHVKRGTASNGTTRVPLSAGLYGGEQIAPMALSMWRPGSGVLTVAVVKNRQGPAEADGFLNFDLKVDLSRASIESYRGGWAA